MKIKELINYLKPIFAIFWKKKVYFEINWMSELHNFKPKK